jgi:aminoglycoside phosphotransferase (APT) family kinase protein
MTGTPAAEVHIDAALARSLLAQQHPDLADLPITALASGWDNVIFRLGDSLIIRLPRRSVAVPLIEHEQYWLPKLPPLPIAIPRPVRMGVPGCGYPWPWSVVPWMSGVAADLKPPAPAQAALLARFLKILHVPAPLPANPPVNLHRGGSLAEKVDGIAPRLERLSTVTDAITPNILAIWKAAVDAPPSPQAVWLHGDLHARNVIVDDGVISAIIDWGDICTGYAATDLMSIWALFDDPDARQLALKEYGASADLVARSKGWVVCLAAILFDTGLQDEPRHAKMGADMFRRLAEDC